MKRLLYVAMALALVDIIALTIGLAGAMLAIITGWELAWKIAGVCGVVYLLCMLWEKIIRSSF